MQTEPLEQDSEADDVRDRSRTADESLLIARLLFWVGRVSDADRMMRPLVRENAGRADLLKLWAQIKHTQGQLTDAVRALERMHTVLPQRENALYELELLRRMAQRPEAAKHELELVGDNALVRKHRAHLELERAFRSAADQKFTTAVAICDAVADRFFSADPAIYKLATLEKALFLESVGAYDSAVQALEALGSRRGFEVDHDRLIALGRTYERRSSSEDLTRAVRVYEFLFEESGAPEYLARLARIAERRGDPVEAARLDGLFIRAFKREQLELELAEVLDAASLYYVPIAALRTLDIPAADLEDYRRQLTPQTDRRRRALFHALAGEDAQSMELFRGMISTPGATPVDTKYLADLHGRSGDRTAARALYLAAISEEQVADVQVLTELLTHEDPQLAPLLDSIFSDPDKRAQTLDALKHAAKSHQLSPPVWRALARFEHLIGRDEDAARHHSKAESLARVSERLGPRIGHVHVAAVYELAGQRRGLVHEIWASRYRAGTGGNHREGGQLDEGSIFGNVAGDMMRDIQNVFVAVRTFVERKFPHLVEDIGEYRYVLKVTKDDEPSGGNSAGIAVALAFISVFLQKPIPQDFAITGSLVADSSSELRMNRVADVDHKMLGVYQRRLRRLIAPVENRADLELSAFVPRQIWEDRVSFARNLTQVMKLVFGDDLWEW